MDGVVGCMYLCSCYIISYHMAVRVWSEGEGEEGALRRVRSRDDEEDEDETTREDCNFISANR